MKLLALVLAAGLLVPSLATADPVPPEITARFDRNGDGRLGPRETRRALRALRTIERRLVRAQRAARRAAKRMRRFDGDRDGWVSPGEMAR